MARYSEEFKQDAINLVKNKGYSVQEVANKLGVNRQTLYKWLEGIRLHKKATSMHDLEIENSRLCLFNVPPSFSCEERLL